ncbi:hypothetical protein PG999_005067 [Apiospora kogelbergensis]|uniref:DBF4-type domain-containing protein n=2 Tax=Apiospora kogelbergensis TaxID=1337665 RepID=A0AAW0R160_9PEZI
MAAVSLSPAPVPLSSNMSGTTRRIPLSNNQNVANSPIRSSAAAFAAAKQRRSYANMQREEAYGQPPPAKKQMLESGIPRPLNSPSKRMVKPQVPVQTRRTTSTYESRLTRERMGHHQTQHVETKSSRYTEKDLEEIRQWKEHHRARFPRMVFYFENIPTEVRAKLARQIEKLGAVTRRQVLFQRHHSRGDDSFNPPEKSARQREEEAANATTDIHDGHEQVQTINPSLLNRVTEGTPSVRRKLFDTTSTAAVPNRRPLTQLQDARPKRNMDVLHRAREMGKKIWSLDKLQRMLSMLLEEDLLVSAAIAYGESKSGTVRTSHTDSRPHQEPNLLQLLQNERVNGPSDRDPTVTTQELHYFKGPYVYIYDFEEKQKPIMVREYQKVKNRADGDWPQFRTAPLGRCPFVEDYDHREVAKPKPKPKQVTAKPAVDAKATVQPREAPMAKPVTGKRSLGEMESAHNRGSSVASTELITSMKPGSRFEFRPNFTSRAGTTRLFGGEPVASGVQPSNVTSAIRSQMISSTAATPGAIGMMSKEVHGLQRKVLQRNSSHDLSSRRAGSVDPSLRDDPTAKRALTLGRTSSRRLDMVDDAAPVAEDEDAKVRAQAEKRAAVKEKQRDPKPGYCENCQDKFEDFEDHIASRKHRKFADNPDNWSELDDLLSELQREPKHKSFTAWTPSLPAMSF